MILLNLLNFKILFYIFLIISICKYTFFLQIYIFFAKIYFFNCIKNEFFLTYTPEFIYTQFTS